MHKHIVKIKLNIKYDSHQDIIASTVYQGKTQTKHTYNSKTIYYTTLK